MLRASGGNSAVEDINGIINEAAAVEDTNGVVDEAFGVNEQGAGRRSDTNGVIDEALRVHEQGAERRSPQEESAQEESEQGWSESFNFQAHLRCDWVSRCGGISSSSALSSPMTPNRFATVTM